MKRKHVPSSRPLRDDPYGHREATADLALTKWFRLYDQIAALNQLNGRAKRDRLCNQLKRTREGLASIAPLLKADSKVPVLEIGRPGENGYKSVKANLILDRLLQFFDDYVQAVQPKRHRGDPVMPQILLELAEISKLTTGDPDWKWVEQKIVAKTGIHRGKKPGRWALRTASDFKRRKFGSFRRRKSWSPIDILAFPEPQVQKGGNTVIDWLEWAAGWNATLRWQTPSEKKTRKRSGLVRQE